MASPLARYTLVFYAPPAAVTACKAAIFRAGAGRYPGSGNYTECCWSASGTGQFRPGDAANPHIGRPGALEETPEVRVETLCVGVDVVRDAVAALKTLQLPQTPRGIASSSCHRCEHQGRHVVLLAPHLNFRRHARLGRVRHPCRRHHPASQHRFAQ
ncbi:hypothetical protein CP533_1599 [Ophiocordyceps camponoti-saundersi (nom. inval.)]|nr:hypothetical protein CP533_1599 [Ophiocordyceps camponoti-saundersi (nom. inval.)]